MAARVKITLGESGEVKLEGPAEFNDSRTANLVRDGLRISSSARASGDELYFGIPLQKDLEAARQMLEEGDLAYWPEGPALCIFFGPTPISSAGEVTPASAVDVVGKLL